MKFHPITGQLVQYKQLLDQMQPLDRILTPQIDNILIAIKRNVDGKVGSSNFKRLDKLIRRAKQEVKQGDHKEGDTGQISSRWVLKFKRKFWLYRKCNQGFTERQYLVIYPYRVSIIFRNR